MTPLCQRMIDDMRLRNFSRHSEDVYVRAFQFFYRMALGREERFDGFRQAQEVRESLSWRIARA